MQAYLAAKPKNKFGVHQYKTASQERISADRAALAFYQSYYDVPSE